VALETFVPLSLFLLPFEKSQATKHNGSVQQLRESMPHIEWETEWMVAL